MHTFLGVPIVVHGEAWGNLYLTEKDDGRLHGGGRGRGHRPGRLGGDRDRQRAPVPRRAPAPRRAAAGEPRPRDDDGDRAARWAASPTSTACSSSSSKRSRALIDARATELALLDGDELVIAAAAGQGVEGRRGHARCRSRARSPARRCARGARSAFATCRRASRIDARRAHRARGADDVPQPLDRVPQRVRPRRRRRHVHRRGRAPAAGVRGERGDRGRRRRSRRATRRCAAACRRPRRSAGAGRASCTTRRCRSSPGLKVAARRARAGATTALGSTPRSTRRSR